MSRVIHRLDAEVAAQIAAGEVVERPVSVIKELLDNALDAKASQISVRCDDAGLSLIQISDNGHGIFEEDMEHAISPHCTSKLKSLNDLYHISSKGFRGEALASICSVSKVRIVSKPAEQNYALQMDVAKGQISYQAAVRDTGSTITVQDLFYNLPVRKKFLKSPAHEWQLIENMFKRFVLLAMDVHFSLHHNGEVILDLAPAHHMQEQAMRVKKIFGKSMEAAHYIDVERSGLRLYGWLGHPEQHKSQMDKIWFYLNGRVLQDKLIMHAFKQSYVHHLPPGRHPQALLYLELAPEMVDINVHPSKTEVRFEQARLIYDFILSSLKPYFEPKMSVAAAAMNASPQTQDSDNTPNSSYKAHMSWVICNTRFVVIAQEPHHYLVDVRLWWQQFILRQNLWESRVLSMPFVEEIETISSDVLDEAILRLRDFGIDLQAWSNKKICIRSIPACLAQFDLKALLRRLNSLNKAPEIVVQDILACATFTSYDLTQDTYQALCMDLELEASSIFAKVLSIEHCLELFK